jgi:hypothetical protein
LKPTVCLLSLAVLVAGCGGGTRQDANEKSGTFKVDVPSAAFPAEQHLAQPSVLSIAVRNADSNPLPDVAVTVDSFTKDSTQAGLADRSRPVWIVDQGPVGGDTAYVGTWALGKLAPGATKIFRWKVTPVQSGTYKVHYRVSAGLDGKAKLETPRAGTFSVNIAQAPAPATVDPKTGDVIRKGETPEK